MEFKLGKKLGVVSDPRTLRASTILEGGIEVPDSHDIAPRLTTFPVFKNDELGDCGLASNGHRIVGQERSASQHDIPVSDDDVVRAYEVVGGYRPGHPETDNGVYLLDVCNFLRRAGMGKQRDGSPHTILGFAKVTPGNHTQVMVASYVFGGLYIGAGLPKAAQRQIGKEWALTHTSDDRWGSWGGHAMWVPQYTERGLGAVTWGQRQRMTWEWWDTYVDEAYALVSPDFVRRGGTTPQGFNVEALENYLSTL